MKTNNEIDVSRAMQEVWEWKEKAYEATKDLSFDQLQTCYKKNVEKLAELLGTKIIRLKNGTYVFNK